ncbi:MAG: nucleotidyl transferase AbiEii/AbiGii toxin family protein [Erysipelotrichaceae bacterium]|nr:nucleotidyl transferase AbiEii/AbiGii toxin family protein [Erysipelotrichaceae bacterium]
MNWYRENKDEWRQIIETVSAEEHRSVQMVEKDTIQSMFLLGLSGSDLPIVFKGGTSLSKAYDLIDRFSEDIDISADRKLSETERRNVKSAILKTADDLGLKLSNPDKVMSRHSYNKYVFEYDSLFSDIPLEMIVETSFYQSVYPALEHEVYSIIGRFCQDRDIDLPIPFEASIVNMKVQSLQRTFIDKVFAICDYRLQDMQDRDSRHLYDIAKILPEISLDDDLKALVDKVRKDRMTSKNNPSAQPEHDIPKMLKEIIASRFYEPDYNNLTRRLLYEDVSYDEAVNNGVAVVADLDLFEYRT